MLQMADAGSIGFQFIFRKPGYRFVELTEYCGFVIRQCSRDWYRVGNVVSEQVYADVQPVDKCAHLNQALNLRFLYVCAVQDFLI